MSYPGIIQKSAKPVVTSGFSYQIPDGITMVTINSTGALATGTITMPTNPTDAMAVNIQSNKGILAVVVQPNTGQSFAASTLTAMIANQPYKLKYSAIDSTWYPN